MVEETVGSMGVVNKDGSLNLNVVLKSVHAAIFKVNSLRTCELAFNTLENLLNAEILRDYCTKMDREIFKRKTNYSKSLDILNLKTKYNENFLLALDIILRYSCYF